jgi:hypothetical protein
MLKDFYHQKMKLRSGKEICSTRRGITINENANKTHMIPAILRSIVKEYYSEIKKAVRENKKNRRQLKLELIFERIREKKAELKQSILPIP